MITLVNTFAGLILPEKGASPNADDIAQLYFLILIMALVVFVGVEGLLIWFMLKFKAGRGRVAAQIHGNTRLEVGWTVGAAVILVFITAVTFIMLPGIKDPAASDIDAQGNPVAANAQFASTDQEAPPKGDSLRIVVDGQQYVWRYQYPRQGGKTVFAYTEMVVPVGMTVLLDITSDDVAHSWWIPELGGKMDAIPGYTNKTWFKATRPGHVPRPVRRAVRAQPRQHGRAGARRPLRRVSGVGRPSGDRHRDRPQGGRAAARGAPEGPSSEAAEQPE